MARFDLEQKLMRRLVDGLAGWITFHQACGSPHYNEHLFYDRIKDIARGRNWEVRQQMAIAGTAGARGARSSVDFVIYRRPENQWSRPGLLFVEVKYLRGQQPSQEVALVRKDIDKLRPLKGTSFVKSKIVAACGPPARFLLIVAQGGGLDACTQVNSRDHAAVAKMLLSAAGDDPPDTVYRASGDTHLKSALDWHVLAIGSGRWPK